MVDLGGADLLRRHVAGGPEDRAGLGPEREGARRRVDVGLDLAQGQLGDAEVEHLEAAVAGEEEVLGLQIAVHDPALVRDGEGARDLERPLPGLARRERARAQALAQGLPLEQLGDDVGRAVVGSEIEHRDDAGVVELPGGAGLLLEAADPLRIERDVAVQDLDRDVAAEARVAGAVDLAHAPRADAVGDLVRPEPGPAQAHLAPV